MWGDFGTVLPHPSKSTRHPDCAEVTLLGVNKYRADGTLDMDIYRRGAEGFHTDGSYDQVPFKATQLYALAIPSRGGSSLGVKFAAAPAEVPGALVAAFSYDDRVMLERFVEGRELAVSVLGTEPLPIVEAIPDGGDRYDFEARYEIGRTRFVCPADLSPTERAAVTDAALATCRALGCEGFARVDLILAADGPWVLEANAIPGLTDTSLLPQAAEAAGMSFENLVTRILDMALAPSTA